MTGDTQAKFANLLLHHIPEEILVNILSRLPVKSLLKFRSVSKCWLSLISSPQFTKAHLANNTTNLNLKRHIVLQEYPVVQISSIAYHSLDLVNHTCPILVPLQNAELLASCDGLLLVRVGDKDHFLWNPTIRKYKRIQGDDETVVRELVDRHYGLAYDSITDTYKVVSIARAVVKTQVRVYNCKTRGWRQIVDFPYVLPFTNGQGVVVNGATHWIVSRDIERWTVKNDESHVVATPKAEVIDHAIMWFDSREEKFKEVANPSWLVEGCSFDLGSLRGKLCIALHEESETQVWVMREYRVKESWTRLFDVPREHVNRFTPLCLREIDEVLVEELKHKLSVYNISTGNVVEILSFCDPAYGVLFKSASYVESLVSPPGED